MKKTEKYKALIGVLLVLLLVSTGALTARVIYLNFFADNGMTSVVPDNLIGRNNTSTPSGSESPEQDEPSENKETNLRPNEGVTDENAPSDTAESPENGGETEAAVIELYYGHASDNEKFQATNMLPGDSETKYFAVKVSHHSDVYVYFKAEVTEETKKLADILHIKVTHLENGNVIYNGSFADMNKVGYAEMFDASERTETVAYYEIEVSLPTSAGNEYQAAKLMADFDWYVEDTAPLDPPQTGDDGNIMPYVIIMCVSFLMLTVLLLFRRREKEDEDAESK